MKKNILILGATSDMGRSFARECAFRGHNIILAARNNDLLSTLHKDLEIRTNAHIQSFKFDVLDTDSHKSFYESLPLKIDLVVCFIGYLEESSKCKKNFNIAKNSL